MFRPIARWGVSCSRLILLLAGSAWLGSAARAQAPYVIPNAVYSTGTSILRGEEIQAGPSPTVAVTSTALVEFASSTRVRLKPGFHTGTGARFTARNVAPAVPLVNTSGWISAGEQDEEGNYITDGSHDLYYAYAPCAGALSVKLAAGVPYFRLKVDGTSVADTTGSTQTLTISAAVTAGWYQITVEALDGSIEGSYTLTADFVPTFQGPTAAFALSPASGLPPLPVTLNASASTAAAGTTLSDYAWTYDPTGAEGDGLSNGPIKTHTFSVGKYDIRLTVIDNHGLTSSVMHTLAVDTPPTATIAKSTSIVGVGQPVTITGTFSDLDYNLTNATLDYLAPDSSTWVVGTTAAGTRWTGSAAGISFYKAFTLSTAGIWTFRAVGTDAVGGTATSATVTVTAGTDVTPPTPPNTLAASNITALTFLLTWSGATDDLAVTGYEVRRNGTSVGTTTSTSMSVTGLAANTTYPMEVRSRDAAGNWSAWSVTKDVTTIALQPPVASFSAVPLGAPVQTPVTLNATGSTDPNGSIVSYAWDFENDGTNDASGLTASHTYTVPGIHTAKLTVTSSSGLTATTTRQILAGLPLQASWTSSGHINDGDRDEDGSYITDGDTQQHTVTVPANGIIYVTVTGTPYLSAEIFGGMGGVGYAADTLGAGQLVVSGHVLAGDVRVDVRGIERWVTGDYTITIGFAPAPRPPVASFTASTLLEVAPLTVTFDGTASNSPDASIGSYAWDLDNNGTTDATTATTSRLYSSPGTYLVKLTVADGISPNASATKTLVLNGPAPTIMVQPLSQAVDPGTGVTLSVLATGRPLPTYQWKRGTDVVSGATSPTLSLTGVTVNDAGSYTVTLTNSVGSVVSAPAALVVNPDASIPIVTTQPIGQSVTAGDTVLVVAQAVGFPLPTYQWYLNNTAVAGATTATLTLDHVAPAQAGSYKLVATNRLGSATSSSATVTVAGNRLMVGHGPGIVASVGANGGLLGRIIYIAAYAEYPTPGQQFFGWETTAPSGYIDRVDQEHTALTMGGTEFGIKPLYCSGEPARTVLTTSQPIVAVGQTVRVTANTTNGAYPVNYQAITVSTDQGLTWRWWEGKVGTTSGLTYDFPTQVTGKLLFRAIGGYLDAPVWSNRPQIYAYLCVTVATEAPPAILDHPLGTTADVGGSVTFRAHANGNPTPTLYWTKNGLPILNSDSETLTIPNVQVGNDASYAMVATNSLGTATSLPAVLSLNPRPVITGNLAATAVLHLPTDPPSPPAPPTFVYNVTASFCDSGHAPVTYYAYGFPAGLTFDRSTGVLSGSPTQVGGFPVLVAVQNSYGMSDYACLMLDVATPPESPPQFVTQPQGQTLAPGASLALSPSVLGRPTPTFQWRKDGVNISGATNVSYTVGSAQATDTGAYTLVATNSRGSTTSTIAAVEVTASPIAPNITLNPLSRSVSTGQPLDFVTDVIGSPGMIYRWRKNGLVLADGPFMSGTGTRHLVIVGVTRGDAGTYTFEATNAGGTDVSDPAIVQVMDPGDNGTPQLRIHRNQ